MQYDLYHTYTVDEHTLFVVRNLRRLAVPEFRHEFPALSDLVGNLPKPELLYLAALFHDIAKGRGGDHSSLGAQDALDFCQLHGMSEYDSHLVAWLVQQHLVMSMTAQRKDIDDPAVVQEFAETVGDSTRLDYLYLLTVADIRATNPQRWNAWKDALLRQLYSRTRQALARGIENPQAQDELIRGKQLEARRVLEQSHTDEASITRLWASLSSDYFLHSTPDEIAWQTLTVIETSADEQPLVLVRHNRPRGGTEVFVCTTDRDNLFGVTTRLIDQLGLSIMDARIQTAGPGCTMNSFLVLEEDGRPIQNELRVDEIVSTLREGLRLTDAVPPAVTRRTPRRLKHFDRPTEIAFGVDTSDERTIMRLNTVDRPGLLSFVGFAFAECGIRLISAKISTIGEFVEDMFIICDRTTGNALTEGQQECLDRAIRERIENTGQAPKSGRGNAG
jgi:[protein-PII] uridylyltransferase